MLMRAHASCVLVLAAVLLSPAGAAAQEKGRAGVFMGYPSLGLIWHATERIAVRPEIGFAVSSSDSDLSESTSDNVSFGASVLFYTGRRERAALYFAPRYAYSRSSSKIESDSPFGADSELKLSSHASQVSGSIGAHYWPGRRFSVFGEAGIQYTWGSSETDSAFSGVSSGTDTHAFGTRSSIAVAWYF